jgi:hypothetical protein
MISFIKNTRNNENGRGTALEWRVTTFAIGGLNLVLGCTNLTLAQITSQMNKQVQAVLLK